MGLRVDTHIASLDAPRRPQPIAERLAAGPAGTRRLGSGLRITSAADSTGLAPAEQLRVAVRSLRRAKHGADGCSLQQKAAIVLDEVSSILTRVRELSASKSLGNEVAKSDARIRDASAALATAQATRSSILRQATVVRAQANVLPQSALRLLG